MTARELHKILEACIQDGQGDHEVLYPLSYFYDGKENQSLIVVKKAETKPVYAKDIPIDCGKAMSTRVVYPGFPKAIVLSK